VLPNGTVAVNAVALVQALASGQRPTEGFESLPRDPSWGGVPFAPGVPLDPRPINAPRPDSGRAEPRRFDYPVSANLPGVDLRVVPWKVLRDAADQVDMIRRCIEVVKATIIGHGWDITVSDEAVDRERREHPNETDNQVATGLRDELSEDIDRIKTWWQYPDRGNGFDFHSWLTQTLEEILVLDALSIYPRMTLGGDLFSFEVLDGSTIKPLLDEQGNTPRPPYPAYQQILLGFPRGEFVADAVAGPDGTVEIPDAYRTDQLIYARRNVRTFTPYGFSPVEQALGSADMWLKRQAWMRAEYTDGVMPSGWLTSDSNYTPDQLRAYTAVLNDYLSGLTSERHRFQMLPKGITPVESKDAAERYKPDYDEFLLKLVCSHFGVLPSSLGFTPHSGLGGKGHQEGEEDSQDRQSTRPLVEWLSGLLTSMSRQFLGMDDRLVFRFLGLDAEDEAAADNLDENRYRSGRMTLNETRDRIGKPRFDFPEADMPMVVDKSGVIFLEGQMERQDKNVLEPFGVVGAPTPEGGIPPGAPGGPPAPAPAPDGAPAAAAKTPPGPAAPGGNVPKALAAGAPQKGGTEKAEELAALRRFVAKGSRGRPFLAKHLTPDDVPVDWSGSVEFVKADEGDASREPDGPSARGDRRPVASRHRSGFEWPAP
jgi:hypothetical protein